MQTPRTALAKQHSGRSRAGSFCSGHCCLTNVQSRPSCFMFPRSPGTSSCKALPKRGTCVHMNNHCNECLQPLHISHSDAPLEAILLQNYMQENQSAPNTHYSHNTVLADASEQHDLQSCFIKTWNLQTCLAGSKPPTNTGSMKLTKAMHTSPSFTTCTKSYVPDQQHNSKNPWRF